MKCPYCKKIVKYKETMKKGGDTFCLYCENKITFAIGIIPQKAGHWTKPEFEENLESKA